MSKNQVIIPYVKLIEADVPTRSGFVYPKEELEKIFSPDSPVMKRARLVGEYGVPTAKNNGAPVDLWRRVMCVEENNVSHEITNVHREGNAWYGDVKPCGPMGDLLKEVFDTTPMSFAIRGVGDIQSGPEGTKIVRDFQFVTFDAMAGEFQPKIKGE